ncbi:hypothetical protein FO519_002573 [Halicephalobus sp. NKZ332]|nr:hypothetical protein FO519_002573 [Halicephalobus sp. NKZ332]
MNEVGKVEENGKNNGVLQNSGKDPKNKKLVFAHAIWRHGKRNPIAMYQTCLSKEEDFVHGLGELVHEGMMEHYELGRKLRKRFIEETSLVSPIYISKEIHIRSTYVNRTITSAQSHFLSFYSGSIPGKDYPLHESWPQTFFPVPVHASPDIADPVLLGSAHESSREYIKNVITKTPQFKQFIERNRNMLEKIIKNSGHPEFSEAVNGNWIMVSKLFGIFDTIIHEHLLDLPRSPWVDEVYEEVGDFVDEYYAHIFGFTADPEIRLQAGKIFGGPILWEIIDRFRYALGIDLDKIKLKGKIPKKYYVYSAHDTSIIQLFAGLGLGKIGFDTIKRPETADAVTIELWQGEDGSTVVKLFYFRKGCEDPIDMSKEVSGDVDTEEGFSLEQFIRRSEPYKPDNYNK